MASGPPTFDNQLMLLSDTVLRAIGRVAVLAGHLELDQYFLTGALIGPDPELRDQIARPAESFSRLQVIARRLVDSRYGAHEFRGEHRLWADVTSWMREANGLMEERNEVMHGTWGLGPRGLPGFLSKRSPHVGKVTSERELDALGDRIDEVSGRSQALIEAVSDAVMSRTRYVLKMLDDAAEA
jgi:hypothetical protein